MFRISVFLFFISVFGFSSCFSQVNKDSLLISDKYLEDQLYLGVTYNVLINQPKTIDFSGFSYGIIAGFIKDIPFNKRRNFGVGLGVGYSFDSFNHSMQVVENNNKLEFKNRENTKSNKMLLHSLEFPFEIRYRTSTKTKYNFWRIYTGVKVAYVFVNDFKYITQNSEEVVKYSGIDNFANWQIGLTFSFGYASFNFYANYIATPVLKNAYLNNSLKIETERINLGIIFYIL